MAEASLTIDLAAIAANWRALDAKTDVETGAVVKADAYGLGAARVAPVLAEAGARSFFVALAEEGAELRKILGEGPDIYVFSGHMDGDSPLLAAHDLIPLLNSAQQISRHQSALPDHQYGLQLDTGMNRLGCEPGEAPSGLAPVLTISHLACADDPTHLQNQEQLRDFAPEGRASLAATGGILLGPEYHFQLTRPGIGLYGGLPFEDAQPVVTLSVPVIQSRVVHAAESVGYGATWIARKPTRVATLAAGYADGILRASGGKAAAFYGATPCPFLGRTSMDLISVDISELPEIPEQLDLLNQYALIDSLAKAAGTIGYEILTSLGARYNRRYTSGPG